jgi:hypothetical protein
MSSLSLRAALSATLSFLLTACATQGTGYVEAAAGAVPPGEGQSRLVLLRPRDKDDGGGGAAAMRVNGDLVQGLSYGEFLFVDVAAGPVSIIASGPILALGACEIQLELASGETVYVDVGPRMSYMVAALLGSVAGAVAVPATQAAGSVAEAMAGSVAASAAGSAAGTAVAVSAEGRSLPCRGPYQLALVPESDAREQLQGLTTSN